MYKALFFDIDDTLLDFTACGRNALKETLKELGIPYQDTTYELFSRIDRALWMKQKRGELSVQDVLRMRFDALLEQISINCRRADIQARFESKLSAQYVLKPHAADVIHCLCGRYPLYAASNGLLVIQRRRLALAGLLPCFLDIFVSDDIGYEKPAVQFFQECLNRSQRRSTEVLMIGDSMQADIMGAKNSRIDACWYNPAMEASPPQLEIPFVITDLSELPIMLRAIS